MRTGDAVEAALTTASPAVRQAIAAVRTAYGPP
jgi:hypothetical protein